jgi:hypothetical protein
LASQQIELFYQSLQPYQRNEKYYYFEILMW